LGTDSSEGVKNNTYLQKSHPIAFSIHQKAEIEATNMGEPNLKDQSIAKYFGVGLR
jgi:hypothetical protein